MGAITRAGTLSPGSLYHHFGNLDGLVHALVQRWLERLMTPLATALLEADSAREGIRAAVDPDQDRLVLADVVAEDLQVLLVVVAAHDDEHVAAIELGGDVGDADTVEEQVALLTQVLHGVLGEGFELVSSGRESIKVVLIP